MLRKWETRHFPSSPYIRTSLLLSNFDEFNKICDQVQILFSTLSVTLIKLNFIQDAQICDKILSLDRWFSTLFMQRPILQPNLTKQPLPKISSQACEMQLCLHNRKSQ